MLEIKDLSKLKITKVKPWIIYFDYNGEKYLLHGSTEDYESCITLYKRIPLNNNGKYYLEHIHSNIATNDGVAYRYIKYFGKQMCYKHIDKEYMVKKLTYSGFCCGIYDEYVENLKNKINAIDIEIKNFQDTINGLQKTRRELLEMKEG